MDSLANEEAIDSQHADFRIKRLPVEKDDTDMLAAIKEGLAQYTSPLRKLSAVL